MKLWIGILIGLCLPVAIGSGVIAVGLVDLSAAAMPGPLERVIAPYARDRWIAKHATKRPLGLSTASQITAGREHYRENCIVCHAAAAVPESEIAKGMNPPPPRLDLPGTQKRSDGELFWIVSQGIRMTGMPAFSRTHEESELWNVVAFLRKLPRLTDEDRAFLREASTEEGHHHEQPAAPVAGDAGGSVAPQTSTHDEEHAHGTTQDHHRPKK